MLANCRLRAEKGEVERVLRGSRADPLLLGVRGEVGVGVEKRGR